MSIGLDIGSKTIKVIELTRVGAGFSLKSAGAIGYSGTPIDKIIDDRDKEAMAESIKKLLADAKITSKKINVSIPETLAFTRTVKFPFLTNEEVESAVKWEAEEYIPLPIKEAIVRHQILERQESGNPPQVLVQIIAVAKSLVEKYMDICARAGLEIQALESELLALSRTWDSTGKSMMLVDFGAHVTNIGIVKDNQLFFSRSVTVGGDAFTRAVSLGIGVSAQQAEEYKATYGIVESQLEGKVRQAIKPVLGGISDEIKKAMNYFQVETRNEAPRSILLSGGGAGLPGLAPELSKLMGLEVIVGNPFSRAGITVDPTAAKSLANFAPLYSVTMGLALRED